MEMRRWLRNSAANSESECFSSQPTNGRNKRRPQVSAKNVRKMAHSRREGGNNAATGSVAFPEFISGRTLQDSHLALARGAPFSNRRTVLHLGK